MRLMEDRADGECLPPPFNPFTGTREAQHTGSRFAASG